jgi:hypothetical protein
MRQAAELQRACTSVADSKRGASRRHRAVQRSGQGATCLLSAREGQVAVLDHVLDLPLHGQHEEHDLARGARRVRRRAQNTRSNEKQARRAGAARRSVRRLARAGRTQYMSRMGQNTAARETGGA